MPHGYKRVEITQNAIALTCVRMQVNRLRVKSKGLRDMDVRMAKAEKEPKVESETLTLRLSKPLMDLIRSRAESENRSLSNLIATYLESVVGHSTSDIRSKLSANGRRRRKQR